MSTRNARPFSKREKKAFRTMFVIGAALIAAPLWWRSRNAIPDVHIPEPEMPAPNGFLYFINAGKTITRSQKIDYAIQSYPPNHKPQTFISGSPPGLPLPPSIPPSQVGAPLDRNYSLAEKEQLLKPQAAALKSLRRGLKCEYSHPPVRSFAYQLPYLSQWRELARILVLESQVHAAKDNQRPALNSALDCMKFGQTIPRGASGMIAWSGRSIQGMSRAELRNLLMRVNAQNARFAASVLEKSYSERTTFVQCLDEEKKFIQAAFLETVRDKVWRTTIQPSTCVPSHGLLPNGEEDFPQWARRVTISVSDFYDGYSQFMDKAISSAAKPYAVAIKTIDPPHEEIINIFAMDTRRELFHHTYNETQNALLLTAFALRAYKLEHNSYPNSLKELTPRYLKKIPTDPFADNKPLQYKRVGSEYSLYSIGPDCVNNNGKPVDAQVPLKQSPFEQRRYRVAQDSKGDIVAGINVG